MSLTEKHSKTYIAFEENIDSAMDLNLEYIQRNNVAI